LDRLPEVIRRPRLLFRRVRILGDVKVLSKHVAVRVSKAIWKIPLDRPRTVRMLQDHEIHVTHDSDILLPERIPLSGERARTLGEYHISFEPERIWRIKCDDQIRSVRIASSGTIVLNDKLLLDTDFGSAAGIASRPARGRQIDADLVIVPWSHKWATYYEFVCHVLSKLCRIRDVLDTSAWQTATVCYPLLGSEYERQYLALLGLSQDALVDTRGRVSIVGRSIVASNLQSKGRLPSPTGIAALRRAFLALADPARMGRRLYLPREGQKRRVLNEEAVRDAVSSYGFEIVESIPANVTDQIRMFREASVIVSPHGSALTNLVWCSRRTRVVELFSRSFTPPMYAYISRVLGLDYSCLIDDSRETYHWTNMHRDMVVDVDGLARALEEH
jgi:hypothetical protein